MSTDCAKLERSQTHFDVLPIIASQPRSRNVDAPFRALLFPFEVISKSAVFLWFGQVLADCMLPNGFTGHKL